MDEIYSMPLQETEEILSQRKKQRLEEFTRFNRLFYGDQDGQKRGDDLTSLLDILSKPHILHTA